MVNRSGTSYSIPKIGRQTGVAGGSPGVQYSTTAPVVPNAGEPFFKLSDVLKDISTRVEQRLDVQAEIDGSKAGTLAGARDQLPTLQDEGTIRGRAFNISARDAALTRIDLQARMQINDYEQKNMSNPGGFKNAADAFLKGQLPALQEFDPAVAQRFEADYTARAEDANNRIKARQREVIRDQQMESSLRLQLAASDELATQAAGLFSGRPEDVQTRLAGMMKNAGRMVDVANQIGPDGQPLFSARERVAMEREAQETIAVQVGSAWMRAQPDMLSAFDTWKRGEASITIADAEGRQAVMPLREVLGESGYRKAEESFFDSLRSELALSSQIEVAQDRSFKDNSDALYTDMMVIAQGGGVTPGAAGPVRALTLKMVEDQKNRLEPERYLALREIARGGGATVTDGGEYARLAVLDADGQDIRAEVRQAFASQKLTLTDFQKLYDSNNRRVDRGVKEPVQTGRDYLTKTLGALSKEIGIGQSAAIGQADAQYDIDVNLFLQKNNRLPSYVEAKEIAENIRERFSAISAKEALIALPLPKFMTQAEKLSNKMTQVSIMEKIKKTNEEFLKIHNGDINKRNNDSAYLKEIKILKEYHDLIPLKDNEVGRTNSSN